MPLSAVESLARRSGYYSRTSRQLSRKNSRPSKRQLNHSAEVTIVYVRCSTLDDDSHRRAEYTKKRRWKAQPSARTRTDGSHAAVLDGCELSMRRPDLSARQSLARTPADARRHQATLARALGDVCRTEFHLHASQPADQRA